MLCRFTLPKLIFADFAELSPIRENLSPRNFQNSSNRENKSTRNFLIKNSNSTKFHVWIKKSNNIKLFFIIHFF